MKRLLVIGAIALSLAGCGGEAGPASPATKPQSAGDDAHISVQTVYSPAHGSEIECVVVTAVGSEARAVSVDCDWP